MTQLHWYNADRAPLEVADAAVGTSRPILHTNVTATACQGQTKTMRSSALDVAANFLVAHAVLIANYA